MSPQSNEYKGIQSTYDLERKNTENEQEQLRVEIQKKFADGWPEIVEKIDRLFGSGFQIKANFQDIVLSVINDLHQYVIDYVEGLKIGAWATQDPDGQQEIARVWVELIRFLRQQRALEVADKQSLSQTESYTYNGVPKALEPQSSQTSISDPFNVPRISEAIAILDTMKFISQYGELSANNLAGQFTVPIFVSDIVNGLNSTTLDTDYRIDLNLNTNNYQSNCIDWRNSRQGVVSSLDDLKRIYASGANQSAPIQCDIAIGNLFNSLDSRTKILPDAINQALGTYNPNDLDNNLFSANEKALVDTTQEVLNSSFGGDGVSGSQLKFFKLPLGQTLIEYSLTNNIRGLFTFAERASGSSVSADPQQDLAGWLKELILHYYPSSFPDAASQNVLDTKLRFLTNGKTLKFRIVTPQRCADNTFDIEHVDPVQPAKGNAGFGTVALATSSENFIFDGGYTFELGYSDNFAPAEFKSLMAIKDVPVAQLLGLSLNDFAKRYTSPLSITKVDAENFGSDAVGVQVRNVTGNYFDLLVSPALPTCPIAYEADCLPYHDSTFYLNHRNYRTGLYQIATRYSMSKMDLEGVNYAGDWRQTGFDNSKRWYGKNKNYSEVITTESGQALHVPVNGTDYAYQFLALHANYASFARVSNKPSQNLISAEYTPTSINTAVSKAVEPQNAFNLYLNPSSQNFINDPSALSFPNVVYTDNRTEGRAAIETFVRDMVDLEKAKDANVPKLHVSSRNTLIDLTQPHADGQTPGIHFDAFDSLRFTDAEQGKFIQVGAVVDLTSSDTFNNQLLFDKNKYLPMNLSIRRKGDSSPLYSWPFQARIGSHTIVQEYWDGTISSNAYNSVPQMPHYDQSGEYEVVVAVDTGVWRTNYTDHAKAFLATIPEPTLTAFSKAILQMEPNKSRTRVKFVANFSPDNSTEGQKMRLAYANQLLGNLPDFRTAADTTTATEAPAQTIFEQFNTGTSNSPAVLETDSALEMAEQAMEVTQIISDYLDSVQTINELIDVLKGTARLNRIALAIQLTVDALENPILTNPSTVVVLDNGFTYANGKNAKCRASQNRVNIQIFAQIQESGGVTPIRISVYKIDPQNQDHERVLSQVYDFEGSGQFEELNIAWDLTGDDRLPVSTGQYAIALEPVDNSSVLAPENFEGVSFKVFVIDPDAEAQKRVTDLTAGRTVDFNISNFNFNNLISRAMRDTKLDMLNYYSVPLSDPAFSPPFESILGELNLAANNGSDKAVPFKGLGLSVPAPLHGSGLKYPLTTNYVSSLAPHQTLPYNISLYDLTGLVYHLYKGQAIVNQAIENTECRNPAVNAFLKTMNQDLIKGVIKADVASVRPKIEKVETKEIDRNMTDQNDITKQIADSPSNNRLTFSNILHSLHYPSAAKRIIAGPTGTGADVKFKNSANKLLVSRDHKNREVGPNNADPNFDYKLLNSAIGAIKQIKNDPEFNANVQAEVFVQTHYEGDMDAAAVDTVFKDFLKRQNGSKNANAQCNSTYGTMRMSIMDPNGTIYIDKQRVCLDITWP